MYTRKRPGQRDVRRDARALLAKRLLGDLDDDLLPFAEEIGNRRERRLFTAARSTHFRLGGHLRLSRLLAPRLPARLASSFTPRLTPRLTF